MSEVMSGSATVKLIVPVTPVRSIVSEPLLLPAAHSPAVMPDAVFEFAAVIASRKVHRPSLPFATSAVLLTVIVLAAGAIVLLSGASSVGAGSRESSRSAAALAYCRLAPHDTKQKNAMQINKTSTGQEK